MAARLQRRELDLLAEYGDAEFGDLRLTRRMLQIVASVSPDPSASFPVAADNDADLEASYRFLNNDNVVPARILAPHVRRTVARCGAVTRVVVPHDTTEFNFGKSAREDLGFVGRGQSFGFYGHFALAVDGDEQRQPLGVLGFEIHRRDGKKGRQRGHIALQIDPNNESKRWLTMVERSAEVLGDCAAIHVMDREGDSYALMASLVEGGHSFVIRMAAAKRAVVGAAEPTVGDMLKYAAFLTERDVPVSPRGKSLMPSYRKRYPERDGRTASLHISATRVTLRRPDSANRSPHPTLTLNVVHVTEPNPPDGEAPIEWRLWTTLPVGTAAEALRVVDDYRCRWRIEEYFKALKTGCAIESRQLETHDALVNALAVFVPVAWRLLLLRTLSRNTEQPATDVLSPVQLRCLAAELVRRRRPPMPAKPTARDAMLGVAGLGGHIKNNGDPGWIVLGRGLDRLLLIEVGYRLASEEM
jgi:hypothetical protein